MRDDFVPGMPVEASYGDGTASAHQVVEATCVDEYEKEQAGQWP